MDKIRVLLVDDHPVVRSGLTHLLENQPDIEVVGMADNGCDAIKEVCLKNPNVVLLDINMPFMDGLGFLEYINKGKSRNRSRVLVLTIHNERHYANQAFKMGAAGFVLKTAGEETLLTAIRKVSKGERFVDPAMEEAQQARLPHDEERTQLERESTLLTERETEVVRLVAKGLTDKQIAAEMNISVKTVERHKASVKEKIQAPRLADIVRYAITHNLLD